MKFKDNAHKNFFIEQMEKTNNKNDAFRKALFYTLGLTEETRRNVSTLYNYKENCIEFAGLNKGWQTGTSTKVTRLAFNLYNGFSGLENEGSGYTPYDLFDCSLMPYMFEAIKLLYPYYAG